LEILVSGI